ncbi:RICIN domain-containing protein, partial [Streptomyces massasporeus]
MGLPPAGDRGPGPRGRDRRGAVDAPGIGGDRWRHRLREPERRHHRRNGAGSEYVNLTIGTTEPAAPVDTTRAYRISSAGGRVLAQVSGGSATTSLAAATGSGLESWTFTPNGDGSYRIANSGSGGLLGVGTTSTATRAWGTKPTVTAAPTDGPTVGQQWFVIRGASPTDGTATGTYKIVNRYSGLVIGLSADTGRLAETTPTRSWTNTTGNAVGGTRTAGEQALTLTPTAQVPETVTVTPPGNRTTTLNNPVSPPVPPCGTM